VYRYRFVPTHLVHVMQYGGFSIDPILLVKAKSFVSALAEEGKPIDTNVFYSAGYGELCSLSSLCLKGMFLLLGSD
jgi:hypothetical protein